MFTLVLVLVYLTAVNLGLPDSLLGVSWPVLHGEIGADISSLGLVTLCVTVFSILMSFFSGKIIKALGHGKVIAFSVTLTGSALLAVSFIQNLYLLILFSLPLGMGGGAIDAAMNDYVARNYSSRQMNFLHCFWGVGATAGPLLMSALLAASGWRWGYRIIALIQAVSAVILFVCMPLWSRSEKLRQSLLPALTKREEEKSAFLKSGEATQNSLEEDTIRETCTQEQKDALQERNFSYQNSLKELAEKEGNRLDAADENTARQAEKEKYFNGVKKDAKEKNAAKGGFFAPFKERGVILSLLSFFFYCGIESSVGNWGATYLVSNVAFTPQKAAAIISFYYMGITAGRLLSALVSNKTGDKPLIAGGTAALFVGVLLLIFFKNTALNIGGYLLIGLGCAPLFPSMVHLTPSRFDKKFSADIIGYQIAFAGIGIGTIPPLTGFILSKVSFAYFPYALALLCVLFAALQLTLNKVTSRAKKLSF